MHCFSFCISSIKNVTSLFEALFGVLLCAGLKKKRERVACIYLDLPLICTCDTGQKVEAEESDLSFVKILEAGCFSEYKTCP